MECPCHMRTSYQFDLCLCRLNFCTTCDRFLSDHVIFAGNDCSGSNNMSLIVGSTIGGIFIIAILVAVIILIYKRSQIEVEKVQDAENNKKTKDGSVEMVNNSTFDNPSYETEETSP